MRTIDVIVTILPCPFCASKHAHTEEIDAERWAVVCNICGGIGPIGVDQDEAIGRWGMRHALARNLGLTQR